MRFALNIKSSRERKEQQFKKNNWCSLLGLRCCLFVCFPNKRIDRGKTEFFPPKSISKIGCVETWKTFSGLGGNWTKGKTSSFSVWTLSLSDRRISQKTRILIFAHIIHCWKMMWFDEGQGFQIKSWYVVTKVAYFVAFGQNVVMQNVICHFLTCWLWFWLCQLRI